VNVVEEGALNRAAGVLGITQPSVSRRIRQLEDIVGTKLLHRTTHSLSVTDEGLRMVALAREIVGKWEAGLDELSDHEPQGRLKVVAPVGLGQASLIDAAADFLAVYPKVTLDWVLTDQPVDLMAGEADVWIKVGSVSDDRLVVQPMASVDRLLVSNPALTERDGDWQDYPMIALSPFQRDHGDLFDKKGALKRIHPPVIMRSDNIEAVRKAALRGAGMAVLPDWLIAEDLKNRNLVEVAPNFRAARLDVVLAYAPERGRPLRLKRFVEHMLKHRQRLEDFACSCPQ